MSTHIKGVVYRVKVEGGKKSADDLDRVADAGKKVESQSGGTGKAMQRVKLHMESARAAMGKLRGMAKLAGPALAQMGLQGIAAGLKYNETIDAANTAFAGFLGSTQKAEMLTQRLADVSSKSPLPLESYMNSAKHMLSFGVAAREVVPYLQSVNMAAVATGQGGPGMEKIAKALGQIKSRGKLTTDSLHQLRAAGVPVNQLLQKEFGLTGKQMRNLGGEGIKADKAIRAITGGWEKQFGPAYRNASKTFGAQWEVAKKQLNKFLGEGLEPVINFLEKKVMPVGRRFLAWLNRLPNATKSLILGGAIVAGLAIFSGGLALVVAAVVAAGYVAGKYHRQIGAFIGGMVSWVTGAVRAVAKWVSTAAKNVKGFIMDLLPVRMAISHLRLQFMILKPIAIGVFKVIREHVKFMAAIFRVGFSVIKIQIRTAWAVIRRLGAIVGNVVAIVSNLLRGDWRGAWNAAKRLVSNAFGIIKAVARGAMSFIKTIPRQILGLFKGLPGRIGAATSGLFDGIKTAFMGVVDWLVGVWNDLEFSIGGMTITILGKEIHIPKVSLSTPDITSPTGGGGGGSAGGSKGSGSAPNTGRSLRSRTGGGFSARDLNDFFPPPRRSGGDNRSQRSGGLVRSSDHGHRGVRTKVMQPIHLHMNGRKFAETMAEIIEDAAART